MGHRDLFDDATERLLGRSVLYFEGSDYQTLWIDVDPSSKVSRTDTLVISQDAGRPALLDSAFGSPFRNGSIPGGIAVRFFAPCARWAPLRGLTWRSVEV